MNSQSEAGMFAEERKRQILTYVNKNMRVTVGDLCEEFSVSPATIRNDLNELHEKGLIKRTHGGALANTQTNFEPVTNEKNDKFQKEKQCIAREALKYINEGDCIAMDAGTTVYELAKLLKGFKKLMVVTYDLNIAGFLDSNTEVSLFIAGGEVRKGHHYMVGNTSMEAIAKLNVDIFFMGANGVSMKKGESAITILKAGKEFERPDHSVGVYYNAAKVFDISQTTSRMKGVSTTQLDERLLLKALITNAPCKMEVSDALSEHLNALYDPEQKTIFVRRGLDGPTIFRSLSQELAHAHLDRGENNRSENSLTAYCASYMLCKKYGISVDTYTFEPMPEKFCQMETADFRQELGKIRDAFKELHAEMTRNMDKMEPSEKPKKERTGDAR